MPRTSILVCDGCHRRKVRCDKVQPDCEYRAYREANETHKMLGGRCISRSELCVRSLSRLDDHKTREKRRTGSKDALNTFAITEDPIPFVSPSHEPEQGAGTLQIDRDQGRKALEPFNSFRCDSLLAQAVHREAFRCIFARRPRSVGDHFVMIPPFRCQFGYNLCIGTNVHIGSGCSIEDYHSVNIGNNVVLASRVRLICSTVINSIDGTPVELSGPIVIEDGAILKDNVTVMPGVTIGQDALIMEGSEVFEVCFQCKHQQHKPN